MPAFCLAEHIEEFGQGFYYSSQIFDGLVQRLEIDGVQLVQGVTERLLDHAV